MEPNSRKPVKEPVGPSGLASRGPAAEPPSNRTYAQGSAEEDGNESCILRKEGGRGIPESSGRAWFPVAAGKPAVAKVTLPNKVPEDFTAARGRPPGQEARPSDLRFGPARAQPPSARRSACGPRSPRGSGGLSLLRLAHQSRPVLRGTSRAARGARRCGPGSGRGPAHPLPRAEADPAGARLGAASGAGAASGDGAWPSSARPPSPCPAARRTTGPGLRPGRPRGARTLGQGRARAERPQERCARARAVGPRREQAAEAQARPRPLARGRGVGRRRSLRKDFLVRVDPLDLRANRAGKCLVLAPVRSPSLQPWALLCIVGAAF